MTSSTSSSSRTVEAAAVRGSTSAPRTAGCAALLLAALAACGHAEPRPVPPPAAQLKLAMFPVQNAAGGAAPIRPLTEALEAALRARGIALVPRADLDLVLAKHRIRFTGGVDRPMAMVLREELGIDAMLVPVLEAHRANAPPVVALAVRAVATGDRPVVLWADSVTRAGDDAPGLLGVGLVSHAGELEQAVIGALAGSVERWVTTGAGGASCGAAGRFDPRRVFRAAVLDDMGRRSVAVLPFTNESSRRSAGDVVVVQLVEQLVRSGSFEVIDPGAVREQLLAHRIVLEGGVSVDHAMAMLDLLDADLVLSGQVQVYEARAGKQGAPRVELTTYVIDRRTAELVWSSTSSAAGDDGVYFFDAGRVHTSAALSCRTVRGVVDGLVGDRSPLVPAD